MGGDSGHRGAGKGGKLLYFMCEKKSPYTASWTLRRCVFNCETRYMYYSSKALNLSSPWKKAMKVTGVTVPAEAPDFDAKKLFSRDRSNTTDGDRSDRNLYLVRIEGMHRNIMAHSSPPTNVPPNVQVFRRATRGWPSKHSPRGDSYQYEKTVSSSWRFGSLELLRGTVDVIRDVLSDDGLCPPVHDGLPPYDPRNGIPFAHIPLYLGAPFRSLDKTVFYAFERGDLILQGPKGDIGTAVAGGFLCVTDQMVLVMRKDGTVPRWASLRSFEAVEYNTRHAKCPFFSLLTSAKEAPDIVFVVAQPLLTADERRAYKAVQHVDHVVQLLQRLTTLADGKPVPTREDASPTVRNYIEGRGKGPRPLVFAPAAGFHEQLTFPLPKAQLARMVAKEAAENQQQQREAVAARGGGGSSGGGTMGIDVGELEYVPDSEARRREQQQLQQLLQQQKESATPSRGAPPQDNVEDLFVGGGSGWGTGAPAPQHAPQLPVGAPLATAESVSPAARKNEVVDLDELLAHGSPSSAAPPPPGPAATATSSSAAAASPNDEIELSDSFDSLLLDEDEPPAAAPALEFGFNWSDGTPDMGGQGTTLGEIINKSFAAYPT